MQNRYDLVCIGVALVDSIIKGFDPKPISASGYRAASGSLNVGGEAVNEAVAASKLGMRAAILCALGEDAAGEMVTDLLRRSGVDTGLIVRRFERGGEWFDCIFRNRRAQDPLDADVAAGPIANDTLFDTLGIVSSGFLQPEEALRLLMIGPEYRQVAVRTEKAARQLRWLGAETISGMDPEARRAEREAYQEAFAAAMAEIAGGGEDA